MNCLMSKFVAENVDGLLENLKAFHKVKNDCI